MQHFEHVPVMLDEVLELLSPESGGVYCDATLGGGGHAEKVLEMSSPDGRLIGIDRDPYAVAAAKKRLARFGDRVSVVHGQFSDIERLMAQAGYSQLNGLLLDLGVSSHQLDTVERGFSFMGLGPLDMRMDTSQELSAETLLTQVNEDELADLIFRFGGERMSRGVARSIKKMEQDGRLKTTGDLAVAVRRVVGPKKKGRIDPATRTFQAIRIAVNDELGELHQMLQMLPEPLAMGGRVVIISFHSLEDKMVKSRFSELASPCICPPGMPICNCPEPQVEYITRRAVKASGHELGANPRARSARVRGVRRIR